MLSNRWGILALLFAVRTGMGLQFEAVAAVAPLLMTDFSLGIADIGLLIGLYHAPGAVLAFPGGAIGQRLGDRRIVLVGLALMISGELTMALAPAWSIEIAGRLLAGIGGILLSVLMSKMVVDWFAGKEMATAMAIFGNSAPFGIALALVALPPIAGAGGRILASCAVAACLALALLAQAFLYRPPPQAGSVAAGRSFWPDRRTLWAVLAAGLIYGFWNAGLVTIFGFGPLMLAERGWTIAAAGSTTSVVLWLICLSMPAGGLLADRTGYGSTILLGGLIGFAAALVLSSRVDAVMASFLVLGIVGGLPGGPIMSLPARVLAPGTRSVGMGMFFTVYYVLQVFCPWLVGHVARIAGGAQVALDLGAVFLCVAGLCWVVFRQLANGLITEEQARAAS